MSRSLPSQRDLSILIIVVLLGAAAIILLRTPARTTTPSLANAGAAESPITTPVPTAPGSFSPAQAPSIDSLPPDTRAQFEGLPPGTVLIACDSSNDHYPDGIIPERSVGWSMAHPAFRILLHGYCVDNPSEIRSFEPRYMP